MIREHEKLQADGRVFVRATSALLATLFLVIGAMACGDDTRPPGDVAITGPHSVAIAQTISLAAQTSGSGDATYQWQSSDPNVATVDASGAVAGLSAGEVSITATGQSSLKTAEHFVVVGTAVIKVAGSGVVLVGGTTALVAATEGASDASYTWSSSDSTRATVDASGVVSGVSAGEVTITATGSDTALLGEITVAVAENIPNYAGWEGSGHANATAEAFRHWDEEDPVEIPATCARCHSSPGFLDYIGEDGSEAGVVDSAAPIGTVVNCSTCHNQTADALTSVVFPSGEEVNDLGPEARCMTCHQGRSSKDTVTEEIAAAAVGEDEASSSLGFINIHYYAAGATLMAGKVRGGYQYEEELDAVYDFRFRHVDGLDTCTGCHDPHSLELRLDTCATCHTSVETKEDVWNIRMLASQASDYDGDGNRSEGLYYELDGLRTQLLSAMQLYTSGESLGNLCYSPASYPYWFIDANADGSCDATEAEYGNRFASWTPRLLKAAYNFQVASKDPGAFAHNGKYIIQLLFDSLTDINEALSPQLDLSALTRNDAGHFNGASEAARHWDGDDEVSSSCSKCHSGSTGFSFFLEYGVGVAVEEQANGLDCQTCHDDVQSGFSVRSVSSVEFPSGVTIDTGSELNNLCSTCHSGRESKATIDAKIAQGSFSFRNVHYLPSGAVKYGSDARVGYEYDGRTYASDWDHQPGNDCTFCHDPVLSAHSFDVADGFSKCTALCHTTEAEPQDVRGNPFAAGLLHPLDYDGDGSATERLKDELATFADIALAEMQVAATAGGTDLCYDSGSYPYWFVDTSGNGVCEIGEATFGNRFNSFTPALMKAAHNYQMYQKDPGAWAHNFDYMAQLLYDSSEDLGGAGAVSGLLRP